jgi:hypothetical protein
MSDRLDERISALVVELLDDPPPVPDLDLDAAGVRVPPESAVPRFRLQGLAVAVAAFVAVVMAVGVVALVPWRDGIEPQQATTTVPTTTTPPVTTTVPGVYGLDELLLTAEDLPAPYRGPQQPIEEEFWDSGILIPFCENGLMVIAEPSLEMLTVGLPEAVTFDGESGGATQVLYASTSPVMPIRDAFDDVAYELDECIAEWEQNPAIGIVDEYVDDGWHWVVEPLELTTGADDSYAIRYYAVDGDGANAGTPWQMNHAFAMARTETHLMLVEFWDGRDEGPLDANELETVLNAALDRLSGA